jgi:diguanylate cyclase (GGDEF)-like protein
MALFALRLLPFAAALADLYLVGTGRMRRLADISWAETSCVAASATVLCGVLVRYFRRSMAGLPQTLRREVELGALLIGAAYLVCELLGSALLPVIYLMMAFLVAFLARRSGIILLGVALAFGAAAALLAPPEPLWVAFASHSVFLTLFAVLSQTVLAVQVARSHASAEAAVERRIEQMEERARAYRLTSSGTQADGAEEKVRWVQASVREIEGALGAAIGVAEIALKTHTCAAFLLTSDDKALKLHDCRSATDLVRLDAFPSGEGVLGGVIKRRAPVRLCGNLKGITYYQSSLEVHSLLAVPIIEGQGSGDVRGVLVADRQVASPFTEDDELLLQTVAGEVLRAIEVERVMGYIKRARDEKDGLYRAIEELNRTRTTAEAASAALESARLLARLDFAALTLVEEDGGNRLHRIACLAGVASGRVVEGYRFPDNTGLVANAVRYGAPLPGRDLRLMERPVVFDEPGQVKGISSLKIVVLRAGERILGTLVAGAKRRGAFNDDVVRTLEVLAMQAAQSILRANLFEQTERMATTDGLTGLFNHRTFQARCEEALQLAARYQKKLSLALADIDHFKEVNDTYGHSAGDLVLKGVARILRQSARDTDVAARYGGEEFCLIMPETDTAGAKVIAERIRKQIEEAVFETELGPVKVTLSLGIATFPDAGTDKQTIIDKADHCLYFAKQHGRNRSISVHETGAPLVTSQSQARS